MGAKVKAKVKSDDTKKNSTTTTMTMPTWEQPCAEDTPQHLNLKEIFASHCTNSPSNCIQIVTSWAEDPGTKTLSENLFLTVESIQEPVNRFHLLQNLEEEEKEEDTLKLPQAWTAQHHQEACQQTQEQLLKDDKCQHAKASLESVS
ncbi:hypothetical protein BGZ74_003477 [Mortierella antarctica]|nr:hypothetical protein BGZ74_003477 [Mortierella antarctica]